MSVSAVFELEIGQTAQPNQCGSCVFFSRRVASIYGAKIGECEIKLPPQVQIRSGNVDDDYVGPTNRVTDEDSCSFWRSTGHVYIEKRRVEPK